MLGNTPEQAKNVDIVDLISDFNAKVRDSSVSELVMGSTRKKIENGYGLVL